MDKSRATRSCGWATCVMACAVPALAQCPALPPLVQGPDAAHFGWNVVNCGDYDEDGSDDLLISSFADQPPQLISGRTGEVLEVFHPDMEYFEPGKAVARTFLEYDSYSRDVAVIGARWGRLDEFGLSTGVVRLQHLFNGAEEKVLTADQVESWYGQAVAASTLPLPPYHIVVGAPGYGLSQLDEPEWDSRGAVFVYVEAWWSLEFELLHIVLGEQRHERLGEAVALLDRLHAPIYGNPFLEGAFAAAAPRADGDEVDVGRVDVFDLLSGDLAYSLHGEAAFDWFGSAIAAAGDVDGDDYNDLIVGAPNHSSTHDHAGRAYVFSGINGELLWMWNGDATNDRFGAAVAAAGDVNGDGSADVLVGAPLHSSRLRNAGRVYLFSGADGALLNVLDGRTLDEQFGKALIGAWQYESSNRYFVGAPMFLNEDDNIQGAAYVVSDQPLLEGDIDQDGWVDQSDLGVLLTSYELPPGDPAFNPLADVNRDGLVNQSDLGLLLMNYDMQCSAR